MNSVTIQVYVVVDEDGDYAVGTDEDEARENYEASYSAPSRRLVCVELDVEKPTMVTVKGKLPMSGQGVVLK